MKLALLSITFIAAAAGALGAPSNAPLPKGVEGDPWTLDDAARTETPTRVRWSLNGLWGIRPALADDAPGAVPGAEDRWGWGRIPGILGPEAKTQQRVILSGAFAKKGLKADVNDVAWYRRDFTMPRETEGRRVVLTFTMLNTRAAVYVDGRMAATVSFPGGEADITPFVRPGERQSLALFVTAHPLDAEVVSFDGPGCANLVASTVRQRGVTGDVYLDAFPRGARVVDGTVECDAASGRAAFVAECEGVDANTGYTLVARAGGRTFTGRGLMPDAEGRIAFEADWPDAPRWDVHTPQNLLQCELELRDASGAMIDAALPFRFGFRDVRIAGRDLMLNGIPMHLRVYYDRDINGGASPASKEACRTLCRRIRGEGFNSMLSGNYNFSPGAVGYLDGLLEACDEAGVLFAFTLPHIRDFDFRLDRPEAQAGYRSLARWCIRRVRNHPSVIMYAMNHNATGYAGDLNPLRIDGKYALSADTNDCPRAELPPLPAAAAPGLPLNKTARPPRTMETTFAYRAQARRAAAIARELDGTRPVYHHESGNLGDLYTVNIYLDWSPVQERSDWLGHWSAEGVKPLFFVEWGMPHIANWSSYRDGGIWRLRKYQSLYAWECAAAFLGDAAYELDNPLTWRAVDHEETLWSRDSPMKWRELCRPLYALTNSLHAVQSLYMADNWRSHRAWGITAMQPWDPECLHVRTRENRRRANASRWKGLKRPGIVPDFWRSGSWDSGAGEDAEFSRTSVGETLYRWNRDDCAFIGGADAFTDKSHHARPGETVRKRLVILNDRREGQEVAWSWRLCAADGTPVVGSSAAGRVSVPPGGRRDVPLAFALPREAGAYELRASFRFAGGEVQRDSFTVEAYAPARAASVPRLVLHDAPDGLTAQLFRRLGIEATRWRKGATLERSAPLVVGRQALTRGFFDAVVKPHVRGGGRALVFEQDKDTLEAMGFRVQNYGLRNAFVRAREPGLGLTDAMLRDWNGEATLLPPHLPGIAAEETEYPRETWAGFANRRVWRCGTRGSVASVLPEKPSHGDWRALVDGAFDLQYAPLMDWRFGDGRVTFCQLDVTGRTVADPVADDIVNRLVARLAEAMPEPRMVCALGRNASDVARAYGVRSGADGKVADGGRYLVTSGAERPADFDAHIAKGGRALLLGLTAEEVARWSPVELAVAATNRCHAGRIERLPPELDGLSNGDWAWHGAVDFAAFTESAEDGNAALRVVRHGKGTLVFWQTPPWLIDEEKRPYQRITKRRANAMLGRLLGNLGFMSDADEVRYGDAPEAEDDPYRYWRW